MELASRICPWADDLWLTMMAYLNKTMITKYFIHCGPIPVFGTQRETLSGEESKLGFAKAITNDQQWMNLVKHYSDVLNLVAK